jgi:uncharacterized protein YdbL (DUF1318 family)
MSAVNPTATTESVRADRGRIVRWIAGGGCLAAAATIAAIALWPASTVDQARSDGERFGEAVSALYTAQEADEVDAALADLNSAAVDTRDHVGDDVANQIAEQQDALARAADGFVGTHTADDAWSVDVYQAELNDAVDDLGRQANDFRTTGPEAAQAFYDGVQDGLTVS